MTELLAVHWTVEPELVSWGFLHIRWYGLFFALAFFLGHNLMNRMFKKEGIPEKWLDSLLIYAIVGTVVGARLGHVFFYGPYWDEFDPAGNLIQSGYLSHPLSILKVWEGGLASHGAAIAIILSLWMYSRKVSKRSILWILDRVVITVALAGFLIRMGNLMNHEIVGIPTDGPFAFIFEYSSEGQEPRHPAQLYEALCYIVIFVFLWFLYWKREAGNRLGLLFGWFLTLVFGVRILVETVKVQQAEDDVLAALPFGLGEMLTMGQLLSIPLVITGLYFIVKGMRGPSAPLPAPTA